MNINFKIDDSVCTGIVILGLIVGGKLLYDAVKKSNKKNADEKAAFEAHRKECYDEAAIDKDIRSASLENDDFEVEQRAAAYNLLLDKKAEVAAARNIHDFDVANSQLMAMITMYTTGEKPAKASALLYYQQVDDRKRAEARAKQEYDMVLAERYSQERKVGRMANAVENGLTAIASAKSATAITEKGGNC